MARPQTSPFALILLAIRARLLEEDYFGETAFVSLVARDRDSYDLENRAITLRPGGVRTIPNAGGGRHWKGFQRDVIVTVQSRNGVDQAGEEEQELTDPTFGHLYAEEVVILALDLFTPLDEDDVPLVHQPIRLVEASPDLDRDDDQARDVTISKLVFQVDYSVPFEP